MFFSSRMSRQPTPETNNPTDPPSPVSDPSPVEQRGDVSEHPSSSHSPHRMSKDSEGYPSWLPKRPPPPAPASTFHSSIGGVHESPVEPVPQFVGGRKPTPRSVRIVSLQENFIAGASSAGENGHRDPVERHSRVGGAGARAWTRASGAAVSPTVFATDPYASRIPQPKFHSRGLHLELLRNPSLLSRVYFYLWPIILFYHVPLQTFFDFNAVFILIQVSKFPTPQAAGVPGSGKNWALGAAAYVACWLVWILVVFIVYELIYSFVRRWRVKRPLMLPIYLSSSAFNYVALTSYVNFCFLQHIRYSAFFGEHGSIRDGLAETFYYFSQNLPTVALLLPRAGLSFALLLSFSSPTAAELATVGSGQSIGRDGTFFRPDGSLSGYARGVLIANCAWSAWRILVLLISWIGLWVFSGHGCAGLCGPRYRWEEEQDKARYSAYSDVDSEQESLPWSWKECTRLRVQDAYEFCLTIRPSLRWSQGGKPKEGGGLEPTQDEVQQVLAAVMPSVPSPARRGALSEDLFVEKKGSPGFEDVIPKVFVGGRDKEVGGGEGAPLRELPYPFTKVGAGRVGSQDQVMFPPSGGGSPAGGTTSASASESSGSGSSGTGEEEEEEEEEEDDEEEDDDDDGAASPTSDEVASGSLSSLGQPVSSRYPFRFRRPGNAPGHGRGESISSGAATSHGTRSMLSGSVMSQSTGNRPSTDSNSPQGSRPRASLSQSSMSVAGIPGIPAIPMPPRHPQQPRRRAGTIPVPASGSSAGSAAGVSAAVEFPSVRRRMRADSGPGVPTAYQAGGTQFYDTSDDDDDAVRDEPSYAEYDPEPEGSEEAEEREDRLGLLELVGSRTSLHRGSRSRLSLPSSSSGSGSGSSRSRSNSRSRADSARSSVRSRANSVSITMRSRAQSLIQSVGAVSQTSLDMVRESVGVRSRASSSMARLEEDVPYSSSSVEGARGVRDLEGYYSSSGGTHSRSGSASANENYTFGQPMAFLGHLRQGSEGSRARSPSHLREEVEAENEIEEVPREPEERVVIQSPEQPAQAGPYLRPQPSDTQFTLSEQVSSSGLSVKFHSARHSERTASPAEPPTPVPQNHSPEYLGRAIPIPISSWPGTARGEADSNISTSPPDMISTAAGSFVTAPATMDGTTTESSGQRTIGHNSSWGEMLAASGGPLVSGQVVMPGGGEREDPSGGAWRIP